MPSRSQKSSSSRVTVSRPPVLSRGEQTMRLQKFLSSAGVDSRRKCEEFIRLGRVTVDGDVVTEPATQVTPEEQTVRLDGEILRIAQHRYFVLNKPKGVVCTNKDPAGRPRAIDYLPVRDGQRLFTVGRLDENTEGLLIVTNDGALAEQLAHPRYQVVRRYRVQVAGIPENETLADLRRGMYFSDGFFHFHHIKVLKRQGRSSFVELELREGKNREIRRLFARAGHKVMNLQRIAFGPVKIGKLQPGEHRELRSTELQDLFNFVQHPPSPSGRPKRGTKPRKQTGRTENKKAAKSAPRRGVGRAAANRAAGRKKSSAKRKARKK